MNPIRLVIGMFVGGLITVGLFMLMRFLILPDGAQPEVVEEVPPIEITRAERDEEAREDNRELQRPDDTQEPPPPPPPASTPTTRPNLGDGGGLALPGADVDIDIGVGGVLDGDPQPIVRIPPTYPRRALQRAQEGWVIVEFTIAVDGTVKDARAVQSSSTVFEREAVRAVLRWRYRPQILNGQPIERSGVRVTIDFQLEE